MTQTFADLTRVSASLLLVLALGVVPGAWAQEPAQEPVQEPKEEAPQESPKPAAPSPRDTKPRPLVSAPSVSSDSQNVDVAVTVTQELGGKPVSKTLSFVVVDSSTGHVRSGIRVPVTTGSHTSYEDVGFKVDAGVRTLERDKIWLDLRLEFSSVLPPSDAAAGEGRPSFGSASSNLNLLLDDGEPITFTQSLDPSTGQQYEVSVTATIVR